MRAKKITAFILAAALCATSMSGCGINKDAKAASMNGQTVTLGVANFYCRYEQATMEDAYKAYLQTSDIWSKDISGNGTTLEETVKDQAMETLHEMYTLQAHMKDYNVELTDVDKKAVKEAAQKFMDSNSTEAIKEMGATEDIVEEILTLYTVRDKMKDAIEADVDTKVSDDEANMRAYTMIKIATNGHTDENYQFVNYTDDEVAAIKKTASEMADELKEDGATLESVAKAHDYETTTGTYDADNDTLGDDVKKALDDLKEGETSGLIETDDAEYFVRIDSDTDKDATEKNRQSIIDQRKDDLYKKVLSGWQKDDGWKVVKKALAKIEFSNSLTQQDPNASTESEESTE